jgi:uncharacterized protein YmfQ (DUF2313 family)
VAHLAAQLAFLLGGPANEALEAAYARMLMHLWPPGRWLWDDVASPLWLFLRGCAVELTRIHARGRDLLREILRPDLASELLADWEAFLGLTAGSATTAARQLRVVSRLIFRQRHRPADFQRALAPVLGLDPDEIPVFEYKRDEAVAMGQEREHYRFLIYRDPTLPGTYDLAAAESLVASVKASDTQGHVIESINFICDHPQSLCDRDVLGV